MSTGQSGEQWRPPVGPSDGGGQPPGGYAPGGAPAGPPPPPYGQGGYGQGGYGQGQPGYGQPGHPPTYTVLPKNPAVSLLLSFFIPGVGSMVNGEAGKGVGILIGYIVSWMFVIVVIGLFGVIGFWVWGMVDAYQGAVNWNRRHGIIA